MDNLRERIEKLSPKRLALLALQLQSRVDELENRRCEPIAIIGMACRIPGSEPGLEGFWRLLDEGRDMVTAVPPERWDAEAYYDPDPDAPGRMATKWGGFLADISGFDASFFGISRREAVSMDPQQRLLLEMSWEALENAGQSARALSGSSTGVFVGLSTADYHGLLLEQGEGNIDTYFATGTSSSIAAGRISYVLGLHGPSVALDTACSASLVAVHLACQSLRLRECGLALAGGVNAILWPEVNLALSRAHAMAPDGRCKTFDSRADGFVRGEGGGIVVLKRLSAAVADGDNILALIRGSAINQDGRSSGITAPNGSAQEAVIRQALAAAGVEPHDIGYVEAHGTGTALGDPIEAHALAAALGAGRTPETPLVVGSVKTNIGHLEAAAGVAGLIKTVLALQHNRIPRHLHFQQINPHIDWGGVPVTIPVEPLAWPRGERPRLAGVSSFGFSGANAHVIVEEAPLFERPKPEHQRPTHILALAARSQKALTQLAGKYAEALGRMECGLGDICFTANSGRAQFDHRAVYCGTTTAEMRQALLGPPIAQGLKSGTLEIAFLFSGQGAQYSGMGKELYATHPVFRRAIEQCATLLKGELEEPLLEVLWGSATHRQDLTAYTQPELFALEYALVELWKSWGITPSAVLGHSVGEYVAACVAGVYSLEDGLKLMAARARLMQAVSGQGAMAAVWAPEQQVFEALRGLEGWVSIAALNAPESLVISGYAAELALAEERLRTTGARVQRLAVSHGFHSPQMREMESAFAAVTGRFHYAEPRVRLISSMTGEEMSREKIADAGYWVRQVQQPVRFQRSMTTLRDLGYRAFVEIGPGSTLAGLGRQCIPCDESLWAVSLKQGRAEWQQILESLGRLYVHGAEVDWAGFDEPYQRRRVSLPTYPFERQRYWMESDGGSRTPQSRQHDQAKPTTAPVAAEAPADWFYRPTWQPKPLHMGSQRTTSSPRLVALEHDLIARASHLRIEHGFDRYDAIKPQLDSLTAGFIVQALRQAGFQFTPAARATTTELQECCGVVERQRMLFRCALDILAEDGILRLEGDEWQVLRTPHEFDPAAECLTLGQQIPGFGAEIEILARCGASLRPVLQGSVDPIGLLFPGGSFDNAERLYTQSPGPKVFNTLAAEAVAAEVVSRPTGEIRVLEIGAGTGGTTAHLLKQFPADRTEYCYTDVSAAFLERAAEKFRPYTFVRYHLLDIEREPQHQAFATGQFDIVIAANVLHATADLRATLRHIRSLLAPSGLLILIEGTRPERWVDVTFGMTEGWWRFRDRDLRPAHPLISGEAWRGLFAEAGFSQTGSVQPPEGSQQALLLARVPIADSVGFGRWLIVPDARGFALALSARLKQLGAQTVLADPTQALEQFLRNGPYDHVVHLTALDCDGLEGTTADSVAASQAELLSSALHTAQATFTVGSGARLWFLTRGAQTVSANQGTLNVLQASLWGLARTIGLEHPEIWGGLIDLDPVEAAAESAARVVDAIVHGDTEDQMAFRSGERRVARLVRREPLTGSAITFRPDALYLITGGLGGLGPRVANWMTERGARRFLLVGRSGLPARSEWDQIPPNSPGGLKIAAVRHLEQLGAEVTVSATDICDARQVAALFTTFDPRELRGVLHLAAAVDASLVKDMTVQALVKVLAPKTKGTWLLHDLIKQPLDFFVMFSSWASVLGARELAHYAAANQFMDALAHYRHGLGLPALSVNWAAWDEIRNASDEVRTEYAASGLISMRSDMALNALGRAMASGDPQVAIAAVDWKVLKGVYQARRHRPLLDLVTDSSRVTPVSSHPVATLMDRLNQATPGEWPELVTAAVQREASAVLRLGPDELALDQGLFELGMDSLMAVELKGNLEKLIGRSLSSTLIFRYPTARSLAGKLIDEVRLAATEPAAPAGAESDASEAELAAMLAEAIQEIQ